MRERERILNHLPRIREASGRPSKKEVDLALSNGGYVEEYLSRGAELTPEEVQENLDKLGVLKGQLEQKGFASSRSAVAAELVSLVGQEFLNTSVSLCKERKLGHFILYYDFAFGFGGLVSMIVEAANKGSGVVDNEVMRYVARGSFGRSLTLRETENYLSTRARIARGVESLKEYPSGFPLADDIVDNMDHDGDFPGSNICRRYAVAGAKLARDLYKQAYEIAASLYPDQPTSN